MKNNLNNKKKCFKTGIEDFFVAITTWWQTKLFLNKILLFDMVVIAVCDPKIEIEFNQNWIIDSDPQTLELHPDWERARSQIQLLIWCNNIKFNVLLLNDEVQVEKELTLKTSVSTDVENKQKMGVVRSAEDSNSGK